MTIVLNESPVVVKQAVRQLQDLVPVWAVLDYTGTKYLERELLMAKVSLHGLRSESAEEETESIKINHSSSQNNLTALKQLTDLFQGRIIDVTNECVVIELSAKSQRVEAFLTLLKPYGVLEAARSGAMAMQRSSLDQYDVKEDEEDSSPQVDLSSLPPG
ncbi:acetolactate synthase [Neoconidiobolus thromboides FSU 785]|nr:acetolactate synthase [Neoconidiobolus thromboides FSU 785]